MPLSSCCLFRFLSGTWTPSTGRAPHTAAPLVESVKEAGRRRTPGMVLTPVKRRKLLAANMTLEIKKAPDILRMPSVSVEVLLKECYDD